MAVTHEVRIRRRDIEAKLAQDNITAKINARQESNKEILAIITKMVEEYPDLRFGQILCMLDLDKDRFNEESVDTLEVVKTMTSQF